MKQASTNNEEEKMAKKTLNEKVVSPLRVGSSVFIRSVTHHYTGRVVAVTDTDILLTDTAWIAYDGRFATALATGVLDEIEPFPVDCEPVLISRGGIIDACVWPHALPRTQK